MVRSSRNQSTELDDVPVAEEQLKQEHWVEQIGQSTHCPNCGGVRLGAFCVACGQKQLSERLKFGELLKDLLSRLSNLEQGLLFTFLQLFIRPGGVAKDYIRGKQRCYANPLTYFFLGAALQLLSLWFNEAYLRDQITSSFPAQSAVAGEVADARDPLEEMRELLQKDPAEAVADVYIATIQQAYSYAALLFFCFPFGLLLRILHGFAGEKFRLGETMVFSLYIFGQMLVVTAFLTPISVRLGNSYQLVMANIVYVTLPQLAHAEFFLRTWRSRFLTFIATVCSMISFLASILGIFAVSFVFHILWLRFNAG